MTLRTRKGTKGPENRKPHPPNQLVRMRSPVQIRIAAPLKPALSFGKGRFVCFSQLFGLLEICNQAFDHRTSHRQKHRGFGGVFRRAPMFLPCLCLCFYCGDLLLHLPDQFGQLLLTFLLGGGVDVPSHALSVHNGGAAALPAAGFFFGLLRPVRSGSERC